MVLTGNCNHSDMFWRDSTVGHRQHRRLLEYTDDNFPLVKYVKQSANTVLYIKNAIKYCKPSAVNDRYFDMFNYQLLAQNQTAK